MHRLLVILIGLATFALNLASQDLDRLSRYSAQQHVSGTIRSWGDKFMGVMLTKWEDGFRRYQPEVRFEDRITSTAHGIPALYFGLADLALVGREIAPLENLGFRRMFKYDPLEITVLTGSYDVPYQTFAFAILVHRSNPLTKLTLQQLAAVFGCGPGRNVRRWGELGLTDSWAEKPIHVYGYATGSTRTTLV